MPRQTTISCWFSHGPKREFTVTVTYLDDPPERVEAVAFFQRFEHGLSPAMNLPHCIDDLPFDQAQEYLDEHPIQEQWSILTITQNDPVCDEDLRRLQYIPELTTLQFRTNKISDSGIEHLKWLVNLEDLVLCSTQLTNVCLRHIVRFTSLQSVDMQNASQVTRDAYMEAMAQLPNLWPERYPPLTRTL